MPSKIRFRLRIFLLEFRFRRRTLHKFGQFIRKKFMDFSNRLDWVWHEVSFQCRKNEQVKPKIKIDDFLFFNWNFSAGSVSALNTIRKEKQSSSNSSSANPSDYDPFSLRNSTKDFRLRCDKVFWFRFFLRESYRKIWNNFLFRYLNVFSVKSRQLFVKNNYFVWIFFIFLKKKRFLAKFVDFLIKENKWLK